jgi:hypothetical protein
LLLCLTAATAAATTAPAAAAATVVRGGGGGQGASGVGLPSIYAPTTADIDANAKAAAVATSPSV